MKFTTVNGRTAVLLRTTNYKNHIIEKAKLRGLTYYTVDKKGLFLYLRDAKCAVDKEEEK